MNTTTVIPCKRVSEEIGHCVRENQRHKATRGRLKTRMRTQRRQESTDVIQWFILMNLYITFFPCGPVWES